MYLTISNVSETGQILLQVLLRMTVAVIVAAGAVALCSADQIVVVRGWPELRRPRLRLQRLLRVPSRLARPSSFPRISCPDIRSAVQVLVGVRAADDATCAWREQRRP